MTKSRVKSKNIWSSSDKFNNKRSGSETNNVSKAPLTLRLLRKNPSTLIIRQLANRKVEVKAKVKKHFQELFAFEYTENL